MNKNKTKKENKPSSWVTISQTKYFNINRIAKIFRKNNIVVTFKSISKTTNCNKLTMEDKMQKHGVYKIKCPSCSKVCIVY